MQALRDHTQEGQLHVTAAQHGTGGGVLEPGRRCVERIVGRQLRARSAVEFLVRYTADPLGAGQLGGTAQIHSGIVT